MVFTTSFLTKPDLELKKKLNIFAQHERKLELGKSRRELDLLKLAEFGVRRFHDD